MSTAEHERPRPSMSESARYHIRVRGHVDPAAARRLRGLAIDNTVDEDGAPVASLRGELPDQAALMGVLHTLNDYQLPLLSAEFQPAAGDGWAIRRRMASGPVSGRGEPATHNPHTPRVV